jgi:putative flippase GtrA/SAM-dependent methyltransferase
MSMTTNLKARARSRPVRYLVVGAWNTFFGVAFFTAFYLVVRGSLGYAAVLAIAQVIAVLQSHLTQRYIVWRSRGAYFRELARFSVLYVGTYFVNLGLLALGVDYLGFPVLPTQWTITVLLLFPIYTIQRVWAFRVEPQSTAEPQQPAASTETVSDRCPACANPAPLASLAVIAPFVAEIAGLPRRQHVGYRECAQCGLSFFDFRYNEAEAERLYGDYRSPEYVRIRRSWEPWYRDSVNDAFAPGSVAVLDRLRFEQEVLREGGGLARPLECAVDFGGDQGQFFPEAATGRRIVVDLSDKPLVPDVERVASLEELSEAPDLIILAHVLEHVSDPRELLLQLRKALAPHGFLYVEVPLDRPRVRRWHVGKVYKAWLGAVSGRRWSFIPCDFASGVARQFGWTIPRLGVLKESEHINFFSSASLRTLLESSGFEVKAERAEPDARVGSLRLGRLGMAAVLASAKEGDRSK